MSNEWAWTVIKVSKGPRLKLHLSGLFWASLSVKTILLGKISKSVWLKRCAATLTNKPVYLTHQTWRKLNQLIIKKRAVIIRQRRSRHLRLLDLNTCHIISTKINKRPCSIFQKIMLWMRTMDVESLSCQITFHQAREPSNPFKSPNR